MKNNNNQKNNFKGTNKKSTNKNFNRNSNKNTKNNSKKYTSKKQTLTAEQKEQQKLDRDFRNWLVNLNRRTRKALDKEDFCN